MLLVFDISAFDFLYSPNGSTIMRTFISSMRGKVFRCREKHDRLSCSFGRCEPYGHDRVLMFFGSKASMINLCFVLLFQVYLLMDVYLLKKGKQVLFWATYSISKSSQGIKNSSSRDDTKWLQGMQKAVLVTILHIVNQRLVFTYDLPSLLLTPIKKTHYLIFRLSATASQQHKTSS